MKYKIYPSNKQEYMKVAKVYIKHYSPTIKAFLADVAYEAVVLTIGLYFAVQTINIIL